MEATQAPAATLITVDQRSSLRPDVRTVRELLAAPLRIPDYQRPYRWTIRNVDDLIEDIDTFRGSGQYRLGTVIVHRDANGTLNIVDGQQRFITFCLIAHHLSSQPNVGTADLSHIHLPRVGLDISRSHMLSNHAHIVDRLGSKADLKEWAEFFFDNCDVVMLTLTEIDEAFQMFDSQNTRGRALYPADLLKAFHIREMSRGHDAAELSQEMATLWEGLPPKSIHSLFADYLFKIKQWANGRDVPAIGFTNSDVNLFKGIREADPGNASNRWALPYLYAKNYTDDFAQENATLIRYQAIPPLEYPFQIDQPVLNGETFFRMVRHYYDLGRNCGLFDDDELADPCTLPAGLQSTLTALGPHRKKDTYWLSRNLFDCLVLYYVDRFGEQELERATRIIVRYAMAPRVQMKQVRRDTINNYALAARKPPGPLPRINLFAEIRLAMEAGEFSRRELPQAAPTGYPDLQHFFGVRQEINS